MFSDYTTVYCALSASSDFGELELPGATDNVFVIGTHDLVLFRAAKCVLCYHELYIAIASYFQLILADRSVLYWPRPATLHMN